MANRGPYVIYYHPGFTGRAEPALLLLQDAGAPLTLARQLNGEAPNDAAKKLQFPAFACPVLEDKSNGAFISQTAAVMAYLGKQLGCPCAVPAHLQRTLSRPKPPQPPALLLSCSQPRLLASATSIADRHAQLCLSTSNSRPVAPRPPVPLATQTFRLPTSATPAPRSACSWH